MKPSVKKRVDISAEAYGWDSTFRGRDLYQRDGYEIYVFSKDDGFELTIRNPETMERETILEVRSDDIPTSSPAYVATVEHVMKNVEEIASEQADIR